MLAPRKRIEWIDRCKGFLLIFVVLLHIKNPYLLVDYLSNIIIISFFFLSGFLFNKQTHATFVQQIKSKSKTLIIPYFLISFLGLLLSPKFLDHTIRQDIFNFLLTELQRILNGYSSKGVYPIWFLYSLFEVLFFSLLLSKVFNKLKVRYCKTIMLFIAICAQIVGWELYLHHVKLWLHLDVFMTGIAFFALGYLCKPFILKVKNIWLWIAVVISACVFFYFVQDEANHVNLIGNTLGKSLCSFVIQSISGCFAIVLFFKGTDAIMSKYKIFDILCYISQNAILLLAMHKWLQGILCRIPQAQFITERPLLFAFVIAAIPLMFAPLFNKYLPLLVGKRKQ